MNLNQLFIGGNLTRDPELRFTPNGTAICKFGVAVNRKWKTESGEEKEEVTFVDIDCFGKTAELIAKLFKKGKPILVQGRLKLEQWDDKQTGQKKSKLGVALESFQFCGGDKVETNAATARRPAEPAKTASAEGEDSEIPF